MNLLTVNVKALRINLRKKLIEEVEEAIARETSIKIYVNDNHLVTLFASPSQLKELAIGWLLSQGIIKSVDEISEVEVEEDTVKIKCVSKIETRMKLAEASKIPKLIVKSKYRVKAEEILRLADMLNRLSRVFKVTGGTHSAAIFEDGKLVAFAEDAGRHSAVDKAIGIAALRKADFSKSILVSSGRQPADMILKAAHVGIPIVASIAAPLDSGVEAAKKTGITLIGFVRRQRMNIYSNPERVEVEFKG